MTRDLPDINVWIALANPEHPHHAAAARYWHSRASQMVFCRTTMLGLTRLLCQRAVMGDATHTPLEAGRIYSGHLSSGAATLIAEPAGVDPVMGRICATDTFHPRDWTDAYLATFAIVGGLRLVSFDAGFARFEGLNFLSLLPDSGQRS